MASYFLKLRYNGRQYAGFQIQQNGKTIQGEVQKALEIFFKQPIQLTGSSRTDAGVHARCNYFHFKTEASGVEASVYHLNAILSEDISVEGIYRVPDAAHSRFDALMRRYSYHIHALKNPFLNNFSWYFPYPLDVDRMNAVATLFIGTHDFSGFSKKHTQVITNDCTIDQAFWQQEGEELVFRIGGNRFLRGMVRALVGTMIKVGRGKLGIEEVSEMLKAKDSKMTSFSVPAHGLFLEDVLFPFELQTQAKG